MAEFRAMVVTDLYTPAKDVAKLVNQLSPPRIRPTITVTQHGAFTEITVEAHCRWLQRPVTVRMCRLERYRASMECWDPKDTQEPGNVTVAPPGGCVDAKPVRERPIHFQGPRNVTLVPGGLPVTWTTRFLSSQLAEKDDKQDIRIRGSDGLITVMPRYREALRLANEPGPDRFLSRRLLT